MSDPSNQSVTDGPTPRGNGDGPKPKDDGIEALRAKNAEIIAEKRKLQERLAQLEADAEQRKTAELAEKERYKELWEQTKAENEATKKELFGVKAQIADARKFAAFQKAIGQAIPEKFHALVDIDKIALDDSGLPIEQSVKSYATSWQEQYGDLFKKPAGIPQDYPNGDGSKVPSLEEWKKLNTSDPKKAKELLPLVFERHGNNLGRT